MLATFILIMIGGVGITVLARRVDRAAMRRHTLTGPQERVVRHLHRELCTMRDLGWPPDQAMALWTRAIEHYTPRGPVRDTRIRLLHAAYTRMISTP